MHSESFYTLHKLKRGFQDYQNAFKKFTFNRFLLIR